MPLYEMFDELDAYKKNALITIAIKRMKNIRTVIVIDPT